MNHNENNTIRTRRIGSISMGICCIIFGVLLLLRICFANLTFEFIIRFWPAVLIVLGLEILISNFSKKNQDVKFDFFSIFMIFLMLAFVIGMGGAELLLEYGKYHMIY